MSHTVRKETREEIMRHNRQVMPETARVLAMFREAFGEDTRLLWSEESGYQVGKGVGSKAVRVGGQTNGAN